MRLPPALLLATLLLTSPAFAAVGTSGLLCDGGVCNFEATTTNGPANEVFIAVDPTDPLHLIAAGKDYTLGPSSACGVTRVWLGYYLSFDGGKTWTNHLAENGPNGILAGYGCVSDPVVAIGGDGTVYMSGLAYQGPGGQSGVYVAESFDGGRTIAHRALVQAGGGFHDKNWMGVDPLTGRVYVSFTLFGGSDIYVSSGWGGLISKLTNAFTFSQPKCISCGGFAGQGSYIAVGFDTTAYVSWIRGSSIVLSQSTDFGSTWSPPRHAVGASPAWSGAVYRTPTLPQLAADRSPLSRNLYLAWHDGSSGNVDLRVAASSDGGLTWRPSVVVNDDNRNAKQFFASICVQPDGRVRAAWIDTRNDPTNYRYDAYASTSSDGGRTWSPNLRLSEVSSDPQYSRHQGGFIFIGDYIGTACSSDNTAWTVWPDTRKNTADAFVAHWT